MGLKKTFTDFLADWTAVRTRCIVDPACCSKPVTICGCTINADPLYLTFTQPITGDPPDGCYAVGPVVGHAHPLGFHINPITDGWSNWLGPPSHGHFVEQRFCPPGQTLNGFYYDEYFATDATVQCVTEELVRFDVSFVIVSVSDVFGIVTTPFNFSGFGTIRDAQGKCIDPFPITLSSAGVDYAELTN
jgi:hypothetical protein